MAVLVSRGDHYVGARLQDMARKESPGYSTTDDAQRASKHDLLLRR